jgi:hypothetical protein
MLDFNPWLASADTAGGEATRLCDKPAAPGWALPGPAHGCGGSGYRSATRWHMIRRYGNFTVRAWVMCRNIRTLFNFEPPATEAEIRAASLQFVRKLSGFNAPSKTNQAAFDRALEEVAAAATTLIRSLVTTAEPRDREVEAARARARAKVRFTPIK